MPPLVMVFQGAEANLHENTLSGGGVAGIRTAGKVKATGNRFEALKLRKAGPPSYAIWALEGSEVTMDGNQVKNYRNAIHASGATVTVSNNTVHNFFGSAFVVKNPASPAHIFDNTVHSNEGNGTVMTLEGQKGIINGNTLQTEPVAEKP